MKMSKAQATELANELKAWRGTFPAHVAAEALGIKVRTYEGIEQGRGFRYPSLLRHAMQTTIEDLFYDPCEPAENWIIKEGEPIRRKA